MRKQLVLLFAAFAVTSNICAFGAKPPAGGGSSPPTGNAASANANSATASSAAPAATAQTAASTAPFEAQVLAYRAIDAIASNIAANVCSKLTIPVSDKTLPDNSHAALPVSLVIYDQATFANLLSYAAFVQNADAIVSSYGTLIDEKSSEAKELKSKTDATTGGTTISKSSSLSLGFNPVSDLTGLLSAVAVSANSETYGTVVIPDSAVAVAITRELKKLQAQAIWPSCQSTMQLAYPPLFGSGSASDQAAQDIQSTVSLVQDARQKAHAAVERDLENPKAQTTTTYPGVSVATALTDIDTLYDNFMNSLLQANATTGVMGSAAVVQGHQLATLLAGTSSAEAAPNGPKERAPAYVLLATVLASGGSTHDHKTFWTALTTGDEITYSGGAVVGVALWNNSVGPIYTDILRYRVPFMRQPSKDAEDTQDNLVTPTPPPGVLAPPVPVKPVLPGPAGTVPVP